MSYNPNDIPDFLEDMVAEYRFAEVGLLYIGIEGLSAATHTHVFLAGSEAGNVSLRVKQGEIPTVSRQNSRSMGPIYWVKSPEYLWQTLSHWEVPGAVALLRNLKIDKLLEQPI